MAVPTLISAAPSSVVAVACVCGYAGMSLHSAEEESPLLLLLFRGVDSCDVVLSD
jgi:hypothetical protein